MIDVTLGIADWWQNVQYACYVYTFSDTVYQPFIAVWSSLFCSI